MLDCLSFMTMSTKICSKSCEKMDKFLSVSRKEQGWQLLGCSFSRTKSADDKVYANEKLKNLLRNQTV